MTLHETYAALIRRGMPKHPRLLEKADGWFDLCHQDENGFSDWGAIDMDDARDLITMHALRWLLGLKITDFFGYPFPGLLVTPGMDIISAILAATEHLEPEKQA